MLFKGRRAEPLAVQEQEPTLGVLVTSGELLDGSRSQLRTAEQLLRDISLALYLFLAFVRLSPLRVYVIGS